jgi:hypothetical protein
MQPKVLLTLSGQTIGATRHATQLGNLISSGENAQSRREAGRREREEEREERECAKKGKRLADLAS